MIYRIWRIKNRITGRYLAAQREGGAIVYLVFLAEQAAMHLAKNFLQSLP